MHARDRNLILLIRVGNLILASFFFLAMLMGKAGCHSALSSSPPRLHDGHVTIREIVEDLITLIWFAGAIGLYSRRRLAWIGSLVGTGLSACFFGALLGAAVWSCFFPDASMERLKDHGSFGYAVALVFLFGLFLLPLAVSLGLFVGLFRMRKELR